jgi:proteasome lid subunit RPN8/RPN11
MFSKVKIKQGDLNHFRYKARQSFPLEVHVYLIGEVVSIDTIKVVKFCYPKRYDIQTESTVGWTPKEYAKVKTKAETLGLVIVGDLHSHPNWDSVKSPQDHEAQIKDNLILCGICSVNNKRTRVRFWTLNSSLPCEIIYT